MSDQSQADVTPVTVTLPANSVVNKAPSWLLSRLGEKTSQGAVLGLGLVWCGVASAAIKGNPVRDLIAEAIYPSFICVVAFLYRESPDAIRIQAAQQQPPSGIQFSTETPHV